MSNQATPNEANTWTLCVVAERRPAKRPRVFQNCYLAVSGTREEAVEMQNHIAKVGFKFKGERFFPDQIETISLKPGEKTDE